MTRKKAKASRKKITSKKALAPPSPPEPTPQEMADARAEDCELAVQAALTRFHCQLVANISLDQVGQGRDKLMVGATVSIITL